jgi:D-alanyl-lipoteichoic acid acyltransferase DltB (MBOAT superfamily)
MLFNSVEFVIFLILVLSVLLVIKHLKFQHVFLLLGSYLFFYFSSHYLISLLIFSTVLDYYLAKMMFKSSIKKTKKILLIISLSCNLGLLGFFKYADFTIEQINSLSIISEIPHLDLLLPIGISFYTFQTISYTIDVYRGKLIPSTSLREFAIFVAFFPQLVAGPILRASEFLPQLREKIDSTSNKLKLRQIILKRNNIRLGLTLIAFGFIKKMFFADNIAPLVNDIFQNISNADSFTIILGAIAFGVQIYGDFSGYSDIAIGVAIILGFKIPINFNKPYFATSPIDFWRRWHISLSSWLRDYVYIPLGGNKKSSLQTYGNLGFVMLVGGLWHGASWNFMIWGLLHGIFLATQKLLENKFPKLKHCKFFKTSFGKIFSILITQFIIFFTWLAFRITDLDVLLYALYKYVIWDFKTESTLNYVEHNMFQISLIVGFFILNFISYRQKNLPEKISNLKSIYWVTFLVWTVILILMFYNGSQVDFIYFRF